MTSSKRRRSSIAFLVALAAVVLGFGPEGAGEQARSETGTVTKEATQPASAKPRPIPEAGPPAQPKPLDQVGLPAELTRQAIPLDNPQTPGKIALGEKLFFDGRYRLMDPWRAVPVTIPPALSPMASRRRSGSRAASASATPRPF